MIVLPVFGDDRDCAVRGLADRDLASRSRDDRAYSCSCHDHWCSCCRWSCSLALVLFLFVSVVIILTRAVSAYVDRELDVRVTRMSSPSLRRRLLLE